MIINNEIVNIQFNDDELQTLLGVVKTAQMRIVNRVNSGSETETIQIRRKLTHLKQLEEKLEQGALRF